MAGINSVGFAQKRRISKSSAALFCASLLVLAGASQAAQDAHEHGVGELNVVVEGAAVGLELRVPGVDVVGFEHKARTEQEKAAVAATLARFAKPGHLFELSAAARCVVTRAQVSLGGEHLNEEKEEKADHGHVDKRGGHDGHKEREAHAELHAEYHFECAAPALLKRLIVNVFDALSAKTLRAAVVTSQRQTSTELTPAERTIEIAS